MVNETKQEQQLVEDEELEELTELSEETAEIEKEPIVSEEKEIVQETVEEKAKPKKKKKDEDIVEERFYTIPLQKALIRPPKKRAPRAMSLIKIFVTKHMKLDIKVSEEEEEADLPQLIINQEVNEKVWERGIEKPPRRIKVRLTKDKNGNVTVHLAENQ